jgi:hypothetical protein
MNYARRSPVTQDQFPLPRLRLATKTVFIFMVHTPISYRRLYSISLMMVHGRTEIRYLSVIELVSISIRSSSGGLLAATSFVRSTPI